MTPHPDFVSAQYLSNYSNIWGSYFKSSARKTHWSIVKDLRFSKNGVPFSQICGELKKTYGMDEDTCLARVQELQAEGLLEADEHIRANSFLRATEKLNRSVDQHVVKAVTALFETATQLGWSGSPIHNPAESLQLSDKFYDFLQRFGREWDSGIQDLLGLALPNSPASQLKAQRQLTTYSYWTITLEAWLHRHPASQSEKPYQFKDDYHFLIFPRTRVSSKTTAGYIKNMEHWGLLIRLDSDDGVQSGKYPVRMSDRAFEYLSVSLARGARLLTEAAHDLSQLCEGSADAGALVLRFSPPAKENVSGISSKVRPPKSAKRGDHASPHNRQ
ncbi:hypothetical protein GAY28_20250 [Azospirillum brasilense]|nr:hypothetical protein [Azospirillum brasilense]